MPFQKGRKQSPSIVQAKQFIREFGVCVCRSVGRSVGQSEVVQMIKKWIILIKCEKSTPNCGIMCRFVW